MAKGAHYRDAASANPSPAAIEDPRSARLSWITILRKRPAFERAFKGFNPQRVARFTERDVERLLGDAGIIRSRAKINAAIGNARAWMKVM